MYLAALVVILTIFVFGFLCGVLCCISMENPDLFVSLSNSWLPDFPEVSANYRALKAWHACHGKWKRHLRNIEMDLKAWSVDVRLVHEGDYTHNLEQLSWAFGKVASVLSVTALPVVKLAIGT